ncbi:MAG: hypothetical protein ABIT37_19585 [Luteolibacter sp.]
MTDGPGSPRTTLFSWDEVPPSPDQQATAAGMSDESVFQSLLPDSASAREDFWDRDKKWAGIFKMNDFAEPSTYVEAVNAITRAHSGGLEPEMEWAAAPESMFALAGLSLGGVFLLRYTGMRRRSGFYFHDCGRGGGLSLCSVDFRPRGSAKRKPA